MTEKLPVLAVAGPRRLGARMFQVSLAIDEFFQQTPQRWLVVHGGAEGVDTLCAVSAGRNGHLVKAYPVKRADANLARQRYGTEKKAPLVRTVRMLDDARPDKACVWWDGVSTGTGFTLGELKRRGIPTTLVAINDMAHPGIQAMMADQ